MDLNHLFEVELNEKLRSEPELLRDVKAIYQLRVGHQVWHVDLANDRSVKTGESPKADLSIEMPEDAFQKLINGSLNITWALATRKIKIAGSLSHLAKLKELFR